MTAYNNIAA